MVTIVDPTVGHNKLQQRGRSERTKTFVYNRIMYNNNCTLLYKQITLTTDIIYSCDEFPIKGIYHGML